MKAKDVVGGQKVWLKVGGKPKRGTILGISNDGVHVVVVNEESRQQLYRTLRQLKLRGEGE